MSFLGWTYNEGIDIVHRVDPDYEVTSSPIYPGPTNPAFVSINVTNVSFDRKILKANFSSVLTVDLLELNKQNVQNISCGDHLYRDTQHVDIINYFTPIIMASYKSGVLIRIEVQLVS